MEVLDTTIANVALRYIAGGLAVSWDEAAWVITTYLVANAMVLPRQRLAGRIFGRKNFFMACIALFTISSFCAASPGTCRRCCFSACSRDWAAAA